MKLKFLCPCLWVFAAAGGILRYIQLYFFFDEATGFLTDNGVLSFVLVLIFLAALVFLLRTGNGCRLFYRHLPSAVRTGAAGLAAAGSLAAAVWDLRNLSSGTALFPTAPLFALAADLAFGVSFASLTVSHIKGEAAFGRHPRLCLLPPIAVLARTIYLFSVYTPVSPSFVNAVNLLTLGMLMGFFLALGDHVADKSGSPLVKKSFLVCGGMAGVIGLCACVPHLICAAVGLVCFSSADVAHLWEIAAASLYALVCVQSVRGAVFKHAARRFRT